MSSKRNFWLLLIPFFASLLMTFFILIFAKFLPPQLPLFYSLPWGEKQLVDHTQLLIIPSTITLVTLCNLIISWQLHSSQNLFKNILLISSLLTCLMLTITFFKIILIFI